MTGVSRFIGILEVVKPAYKDSSLIWKDEDFPCRLKVKIVIALTPETAVPVRELGDKISSLKDIASSSKWTGHFRGSPTKWKNSDAEAVVESLMEANRNPIKRPVDPAKLARKPKALTAKIGSVTVPETDEVIEDVSIVEKEVSAHTEIQWLLLKLGSDMGLDIWVA